MIWMPDLPGWTPHEPTLLVHRSNPVGSKKNNSPMSFDVSTLPKPAAVLLQKQLKALGFYHGTTRGIPRGKTQAAYDRYVDSLKSLSIIANPSSGALINAFIRIARAEVGVREHGGNNRGKRVQEYQDGADWLDGTGWAWCAAFICWVFDELEKEFPLPFKKPEGAGAFWFEDWARQQGLKVLTGRAKVKKGDIVIYSFSHIGIASGDESKGRFKCVEGNTNDGGSRDGDGVFEKSRSKSGVRSIIRPFA
jgi:hypothetical protein